MISKLKSSNPIWLVVVALVVTNISTLFLLFGGDPYDSTKTVELSGRRTLLDIAHEEHQAHHYGHKHRYDHVNGTYTINDSIRDLKVIFKKTNTDKGYVHGYYRTYGRIFHAYKNDPVRLLEIGVYTGRSMQAWEMYFPNYDHIYGIGYGMGFAEQGRKKDVAGKKVTLYNGDQSDIEFLNYVCQDAGEPFDIIVDDGSHVPDHQQISLENLLDCLKPGGLYIIEDMFTSYWNKAGAEVYGYKLNQTGLYQPGSFVERVKKLVDVINREQHLHLNMTFFKNDHKIASMNFEQDLVVFRKIDSWDMPFQDRVNEFVLRGAEL